MYELLLVTEVSWRWDQICIGLISSTFFVHSIDVLPILQPCETKLQKVHRNGFYYEGFVGEINGDD